MSLCACLWVWSLPSKSPFSPQMTWKSVRSYREKKMWVCRLEYRQCLNTSDMTGVGKWRSRPFRRQKELDILCIHTFSGHVIWHCADNGGISRMTSFYSALLKRCKEVLIFMTNAMRGNPGRAAREEESIILFVTVRNVWFTPLWIHQWRL